MKDAYYFPHDFNAQDDPKCAKLLRCHGLAGYGLYWALVERLYSNGGRLPADFDTLAYTLRTDAALVSDVVTKYDLFYVDGQDFGSASVDRRIKERAEKSDKARASAYLSVAARSASAQQPFSVRSTSVQLERKGKEKKGEERKEIGAQAPFTIPAIEEVAAYCLERGSRVDPQRWHDFYAAKGWMVGRNKMKDWRAAVRTWEKNATAAPAPVDDAYEQAKAQARKDAEEYAG